MNNHIWLIVSREYLSRVKRKSFIFSTILMPVLMIGLMAVPSLVAIFGGPEDKKIAVVDQSGVICPLMANTEGLTFVASDKTIDELKRDESFDGVLVLPADIVDNPEGVTLYTAESASPQTEAHIAAVLNGALQTVKLQKYDNIPDLERIMADLHTSVSLKTVRTDGEAEQTTSSMASSITGMLMSLILYMFIMLYGQMVMTSIIEEKNSRVLEIVVSSVRPSHLMLGKIMGIGAVAVTQLLIWTAIIGAFTAFVMPGLISNAMTAGADVDLMALLQTLGDTGYILGIFGLMGAFLVLGYLFYSAIYATIGSAVDNIQDASQLQSIAIVPIILGMVFSMSVINDPNSTMALVLSMIPFTSPMVMMARVPFGIDAWQIVASLGILLVSMFVMVWVSAKVYRVGIFMYGKKPTVREIIRWARYK